MTITPEQSKAARSLLGWTQKELAENAGVGISTVVDFESSKRVPIKNNLVAIRTAFERGSIDFIGMSKQHLIVNKDPAVHAGLDIFFFTKLIKAPSMLSGLKPVCN